MLGKQEQTVSLDCSKEYVIKKTMRKPTSSFVAILGRKMCP